MQKATYWLENKNLFQILKISGILVIPVILYMVPVGWLNDQHSICLFKNITGHECWGCGMTRAIVSAIHLRFENAFYYNRLFIIVLPLLIYVWIKSLINEWAGRVII
jgi:hypothetical protein